MELLHRYLTRVEFSDYKDFAANFDMPMPDRFNFAFDVVDYWAHTQPSKRALVYTDDTGHSRTISFSEISALSSQAAHYFLSAGIQKNDVVMLTLKRCWQFWTLSMALHKIGAIAVPATEMLKQKDFEYRFERAGVKMIVCKQDDEAMDAVDGAVGRMTWPIAKATVGDSSAHRDGWVNIDTEMSRFPDTFERTPDSPCNEDLMLMYFTSGTSGNPKIVAHDHYYPLGHITTAYYWGGVEDNGLHFSVSETGWAKCAWGKLYGQWLCGCAVMVYDMDQFSASRLLDVIEAFPITSFCCPPTIYRFLILEDLKVRDLSHLKHCTTAGEALSAAVFDMWKENTGLKIREGFGQSESVIIAGTFKWMEPKPGSLGRPNPLFDVKLVNQEGQFSQPGEEGQISIVLTGGKSPVGLFSAYFNDEEKTKYTFSSPAYYTGDLSYADEEGCLWYIGRADDIIKTSGYRVGPFEVESVLLKHPSVLECAITGAPDAVRGQVIKATVVLREGCVGGEALIQELKDFVKTQTAPYKYPRIIEFADKLPKTFNGKIKRYELREGD